VPITYFPGESPDPPKFDYDEWGRDENGELYHTRYGFNWPRVIDIDAIYIELECFREGRAVEEGGLGRYGHLQEAITLLWNWGGKERIQFNPWFDKTLEEACNERYLAVAGCSSSSKSFAGAVFVWVNWLADPLNTLGLVTSTSVSAAKKRIWKSIVQLFGWLPPEWKKKAKLKPSLNMIHYVPPDGSIPHDGASISLVAAEPKQEASAVAKLIGLKNTRVIMIADELAELSPAVLAAVDNLESNPEFWMLGLSNPKSIDDPFGLFCEPEDGWESIDEGTFEWKTKMGKCIRFDCLQSPNYTEDEVIYTFMLTREKIERAKQRLGETSARFFRFYRGFFPPSGAEDVLYSEVDFRAYMRKTVEWGSVPPIKVAGLDPSFSSEGDRTILAIGLLGKDTQGVWTLEYQGRRLITENAADKTNPRSAQICAKLKKILDDEKIEYRNFAVDNTGGGRSFSDWLTTHLSKDILRIEFGGKASEMPVTANDRIPASKKFFNRIAELWGVGQEFLRGGQFAGFEKDKDLMVEMKSRRFDTVKGGDGERIRVEKKKDMKKRTGRSPDVADAVMVMIDLCRQRHHFRSAERGLAVLSADDYRKQLRRLDVWSRSGHNRDWARAG
jgi:hypothetical protein